jgi:hypothetical protein
MADVSVEFGAKDTGLEATLRSVQSDLETLRSEMENTAMSTDEATSALRRMRQLEGLESQLQTMADAARDVGDASADSSGMVDDASDSMHGAGDAATDAGERSEMGFGQMAAAVATGQLAVEAAMGAIKAAIDGVSAMFDGFGDAIDMGGKLDILSTRTGVASGELARLGRALQNTGMDADRIGPIFDRFNIAIAEANEGTGKAGAALAKLGIPLEQLKGLAPEQQFEVIGTAISGVSDRSERMNTAIDIFGRGSGTRLLRLFEDYEGTMARVDQQLGIFPRIMNEMSAAFEDTGTEMAAIDDKFVEFASGVISEFMPAIQAIAKGLASIDAAKIGQDLAAMFKSGTEGMTGFQAAIDAIKLGDFKTSFALIFESIVFQLKDTGNQTYNILTAAFGTVAEFFRDTFRSDGPTFMVLTSAIDYVANYLSSKLYEAASGIATALGPLFGEAGEAMQEKMQQASFASEAALMRIGATAELAGEDMVRALSESPQVFSELMDRANGKLFDTAENAKRIEELQAQVALKTEEAANNAADLNDENSKGNDILNNRGTIIDAQKQLAIDQYQQQIELNNLIAEGNTEEARRIELKNEIAELAEKIKKETGLSADEALEMSGNLLISKNSADAATEASKKLAQELGGASGRAADMNASLSGASGNAGGLTGALKGTSGAMETVAGAAQRINEAKMSGGVGELNAKIDGVQQQYHSLLGALGIPVHPNVDLSGMIRDLGLGTVLLDDTSIKAEQVQRAMDALAQTPAADLTPLLETGSISTKIGRIGDHLREKFVGLDVTPYMDRVAVGEGIEATKDTIESALVDFAPRVDVDVDPDAGDFESQVDSLVADLKSSVEDVPVTTDLDASESVKEIREALAEPVTVKLVPEIDGGSGDNSGGMTLADVVTELKAIKEKLPMQALA